MTKHALLLHRCRPHCHILLSRMPPAGRNGGAINAFTVAPGRAWSVSNSRFTDNVAMLNPLDRGEAVLDRCGGGAIFSNVGEMLVSNSYFARNKVRARRGHRHMALAGSLHECIHTVVS